jgi:hypothetical protein
MVLKIELIDLAKQEGLKASVFQASYRFTIELFLGHCVPA